jgi:hypothetical protein
MPLKPYNILHRILSWNSQLQASEKRDTEAVVDSFIAHKIKPTESMTRGLMRHIHASNSVWFGAMATTVHPLLGGLALLEHSVDHLLHVVALQKARHFVRYANKAGLKDSKQLEYGVQNFMMKQGGLVYSTLAVAKQSHTLKNIAEGRKVTLVKGPLYKPVVKHFWKKLY